MKKMWIILFFVNLNCWAEVTYEKYMFGKEEISFYLKDRILISKNCEDQKKECEALSAVKQILKKSRDSKIKEEDSLGGKDPQAVLCSSVLNGTPISGKSEKGNSRLFCFMEDQSVIGLN